MNRTQFILVTRREQRRRRNVRRLKRRLFAYASALLLVLVTLVGVVGIAHSLPPAPAEVAAWLVMNEHSAPALVVQTVRKPESGRPASPPLSAPAVRKSMAIRWVTPAEAKASSKPNWYACHAPKGVPCPGCIRAERMYADPRIIAWSGEFDCVRASAPPPYPCDVFTSEDGKWRRENGCPPTMLMYMDRFSRAKTAMTNDP